MLSQIAAETQKWPILPVLFQKEKMGHFGVYLVIRLWSDHNFTCTYCKFIFAPNLVSGHTWKICEKSIK